jgi:hypothetical protein
MTFRTEFPTFDAASLPAIPADFVDTSWHNDACPSFTNEALNLRVWVDFADPADREFDDARRFGLCWNDDNYELVLTDDWSEILRAIDARRLTVARG